MDEEKLKEWLSGVMDGLSDEQRKKAEACANGKALFDLLAAEGVFLPDELLDGVAGGLNGEGTIRFVGNWAIDDGFR